MAWGPPGLCWGPKSGSKGYEHACWCVYPWIYNTLSLHTNLHKGALAAYTHTLTPLGWNTHTHIPFHTHIYIPVHTTEHTHTLSPIHPWTHICLNPHSLHYTHTLHAHTHTGLNTHYTHTIEYTRLHTQYMHNTLPKIWFSKAWRECAWHIQYLSSCPNLYISETYILYTFIQIYELYTFSYMLYRDRHTPTHSYTAHRHTLLFFACFSGIRPQVLAASQHTAQPSLLSFLQPSS